jgi:hypothetical protein
VQQVSKGLREKTSNIHLILYREDDEKMSECEESTLYNYRNDKDDIEIKKQLNPLVGHSPISRDEVKETPLPVFSLPIELIEIELNFENMRPCLMPTKKSIKEQVLEFVKNNPRVLTSAIIERFRGFDSWEILEILDTLKAEGKIK